MHETGDSQGAEVVPARPTVMAALPLVPAARHELGELLGATVVDIREPVEHPDVVITPACSPQLIGALKERFHGAPVVIVELSDDEFDIDLTGPVTRVLDGGADAYVLADSLGELARKLAALRPATPQPQQVARQLGAPTMDDLIAAFLAESIEYTQRTRRA